MSLKNSNIKYPEVHFFDVAGMIWKGIRKYKISLFLTLFGVAAASVFSLIVPIYYKKFFDILTNTQDKILIAPQLVNVLFIILALNFSAWIFWRIGSFANSSFQSNSMASLRQQSFNHLMHHSYSFFTNNFTGALVQRVGRYARAFEKIADRVTWDIVSLVVRLIGVLIVTASINIDLTILIVVWTFIYMLVSYFYSKWRLKYNIKAAAADSHTTAVLADSITNQNNIELFSKYEYEKERFKEATVEQQEITQKNWNVNMGLDSIQSFLGIAISFVVFYVAVYFWKQNIFTVGSFVLVQMYIVDLSDRLWNFSRIIRDLYEGYADSKEMVEIMLLPYEIKDTRLAKPINISKGEVVFDKVDFSFSSARKILENIDFKIKAGEKIALVGPSGAGKTTIARLLLRFYDVTKGIITIDGQNIKNITLKSLRNGISLVPQDPLLFHRTIKENIRYGKQDATDAEVIEAARLAHCDEFINSFSKKYDTYVGERGIKLSGGERQRVAIARAILKNAPILVLDEATSSLDSHSESLIQDALDNLMKGKTVIVIAHRLSTIKKMDRIIILENGIIIEDGSHDDLINNEKGLYKKLWTLQAGGFIQ